MTTSLPSPQRLMIDVAALQQHAAGLEQRIRAGDTADTDQIVAMAQILSRAVLQISTSCPPQERTTLRNALVGAILQLDALAGCVATTLRRGQGAPYSAPAAVHGSSS